MPEFTIVEIINLITHLYCPPNGYYIYDVENTPEARKFIDAGYVSVDEEYDDKYVINDEGNAVLYPYVEQFAKNLIHFMEKNRMECPFDVAVAWFAEKYNVATTKSEDICYYLFFILNKFGYKVYKTHSVTVENGYRIEKILDT